ncbi:unnamed protein product [Polarella glacialis]|uniref:Bifunctional lysine-specific demethylase and histidyl-hydroxylase n=1 Tax=Polarella glacialis TaxID=89957 RepID=A0A813IJS2_POLGL|nr:unnamed protein product [Polarella glacialis]CAE8650480.1 unnamed protein product [Polarella glacialis]
MASARAASGAEMGARVIDQLLTEEFFQDHWERVPLHLRAADGGKDVNHLPELLSVDDVADIIGKAGPSLKMFKHNEPSRLRSFLLAYLDGTSMIVNQADRHNQVILEFCRSLADHFFHHVFAVLYLTPPGSQAVRLHNDDQDVFLFQVWGSKRWTVRNAPQLLPYTEEMLGKDCPVPENLVGPPLLEFTMEAHDVLYIPRGYLHEAATGEEASLHITFTIPTSDYCWGVNLVKHLTGQLRSKQLPGPQRSLCQSSLAPRGAAGPAVLDDAALDEKLQELLGSLASQLSAEDVVRSFEQRMERTNDNQGRQFSMMTGGERGRPTRPPRVTEDTRVRLMPGVSCHCEPDSEMAVFSRSGDGQHLEMPILKSSSGLVCALTSKPQWVRDLPTKDPFQRLCVLQLLLEHGVLQLFLKGPEDVPEDPDEPLR